MNGPLDIKLTPQNIITLYFEILVCFKANDLDHENMIYFYNYSHQLITEIDLLNIIPEIECRNFCLDKEITLYLTDKRMFHRDDD